MSKPIYMPHDALLVRAAARALQPLCRYFDVTLEGVDNLPDHGAALLVGNHALLGIDSLVMLPALYEQIGRVPRGMALRSLFRVPGLRGVLRHLGAVEGRRDSAVELLLRGDIVVTYPGGARDSIKGREQRYELQWEGRRGFAHVAMQAAAPIIPVAAIGPDDVFPILSERGLVAAPFLGDDTYRVPLFLPVARPVPCRFIFGEPIVPPQLPRDAQPEGAEHKAAVEEFAARVRDALEELIERGLAEQGAAASL